VVTEVPPATAKREDAMARPAPAVRATGRLRVRAFPADAEIRVDGRVLGQGVVFDAPLSVGARRLRITAFGYQPFDTTVTIVADDITALPRINLQPDISQ
jgi:hypothetical protein